MDTIIELLERGSAERRFVTLTLSRIRTLLVNIDEREDYIRSLEQEIESLRGERR
jgi:hypothetical protein